MLPEAPRAVIDTNIWVSALLSPMGTCALVVHALQEGRFALILSEPLMEEIAAVVARPRFAARYRISPADTAALYQLLRRNGASVVITGAPQGCRDPKDDMVIETAALGRASYVVSRDEDLTHDPDLAVRLRTLGIEAVTVRQFLARLGV